MQFKTFLLVTIATSSASGLYWWLKEVTSEEEWLSVSKLKQSRLVISLTRWLAQSWKQRVVSQTPATQLIATSGRPQGDTFSVEVYTGSGRTKEHLARMVFELTNGQWAVNMALTSESEIKIRTATFYTFMEYNALGVLYHLLEKMSWERDGEDLLG